jgi:hypothetical protein
MNPPVHLVIRGRTPEEAKGPKTHLGLLIENTTVTAYKSDGTKLVVMESGQIKL